VCARIADPAPRRFLVGAVLFALAVLRCGALQRPAQARAPRPIDRAAGPAARVAGALFSRQASATALAALKGRVIDGKLEYQEPLF